MEPRGIIELLGQ